MPSSFQYSTTGFVLRQDLHNFNESILKKKNRWVNLKLTKRQDFIWWLWCKSSTRGNFSERMYLVDYPLKSHCVSISNAPFEKSHQVNNLCILRRKVIRLNQLRMSRVIYCRVCIVNIIYSLIRISFCDRVFKTTSITGCWSGSNCIIFREWKISWNFRQFRKNCEESKFLCQLALKTVHGLSKECGLSRFLWVTKNYQRLI